MTRISSFCGDGYLDLFVHQSVSQFVCLFDLTLVIYLFTFNLWSSSMWSESEWKNNEKERKKKSINTLWMSFWQWEREKQYEFIDHNQYDCQSNRKWMWKWTKQQNKTIKLIDQSIIIIIMDDDDDDSYIHQTWKGKPPETNMKSCSNRSHLYMDVKSIRLRQRTRNYFSLPNNRNNE